MRQPIATFIVMATAIRCGFRDRDLLLPTGTAFSFSGIHPIRQANPLKQQQKQYSDRSNRLVVCYAGSSNNNKKDRSANAGAGGGGGPLEFIRNPYQSKIPPELEQEIYQAESRTAAAQNRGYRIAAYAMLCLIGVAVAFFNGFLSELRNNPGPDGTYFDFDQTEEFAWIQDHGFFQFIFMNRIGGALSLLGGGAMGFLAEAELDTRRLNAERIWEELQRRRELKMKRNDAATVATGEATRKNKRRSGKESKRIGALVELVDNHEATTVDEVASSDPVVAKKSIGMPVQTPLVIEEAKESASALKNEEDTGGILGTVKSFYQRADSMAASQALLLNKKLEEAGVLEKITDESGLRVIGRETAKKIQEERSNSMQATSTAAVTTSTTTAEAKVNAAAGTNSTASSL